MDDCAATHPLLDHPIRELMSTSLVSVSPPTQVGMALREAAQHRVHHVLVIQDGCVEGLLCLCDLHGATPDAPVSELMTVPVVGVESNEPIEAAISLMRDLQVGCLPVLEDGRPVGVVTRADMRRAGFSAADMGGEPCTCRA